LNNCTVEYNTATEAGQGAGTYNQIGFVRNSIVLNNQDAPFRQEDDFWIGAPSYLTGYSYSCSFNPEFQEVPPGTGNIGTDPQFLDLYHISVNSPCRGAGSALYASGTDFDGESWNNPPSMGCAEVVVSNLVGPLSVALTSVVNGSPPQTNILVTLQSVFVSSFAPHFVFFTGTATGHVAYLAWNFGDGQVTTNAGYAVSHYYTNTGAYNVEFTAYNDDHPAGVSTNLMINVVPLNPPQLQSLSVLSNVLQFQFVGQVGANYAAQYTTNLTPPVNWATLQSIFDSDGRVYQIQEAIVTNEPRFYRVQAQ